MNALFTQVLHQLRQSARFYIPCKVVELQVCDKHFSKDILVSARRLGHMLVIVGQIIIMLEICDMASR
jgi:hypothetical protein